MTECRTCHQPVDHRPLSTVELLDAVRVGLEAAVGSDPNTVYDVVAARAPGALARTELLVLTLRLLATLGDPARVRRLVSGQLVAEVEIEWLQEWFELPPYEGPDR